MKINWYKNLRMRTQIVLFTSFIILFVFVLQLLLFLINITLLQNLIQEQSATIMSRENFNGLNSSLSLITNYISEQQYRTISKISSINSMHQLVQNVNNYTTLQQQPNNCFTSSIFKQQQVFCYLIYNYTLYQQSKTKTLDYYFNLVAQLDSFILSFYDAQVNHDLIYLADNSDFAFTAYYPPMFYYGFNPQETYPYRYHMEYIQSHPDQKFVYPLTQIVPNLFDKTVYLYNSITTSLHTSNNTLSGMVGQTFLPLQQYYDEIPYNILFVNSQQEIIMASVEWQVDYSQTNYIFAKENSGFNMEDWIQIYKLSQHQSFVSNCSQRIQIGQLCRYNSLLDKEVLIQSYNFQADNSTLIITQNITTQNLVNQQISRVKDQLLQESVNTMIVQIASTAISSIISLILIQQISRSFQNIMRLSKCFVSSFGNNINRKLFFIFKAQVKKGSVQSKLEENIYKFNDSLISSKKKCEQCRDIEQFAYNKINHSGILQSHFQEEIHIKLNNLQNNIQYKQLGQQINYFLSQSKSTI